MLKWMSSCPNDIENSPWSESGAISSKALDFRSMLIRGQDRTPHRLWLRQFACYAALRVPDTVLDPREEILLHHQFIVDPECRDTPFFRQKISVIPRENRMRFVQIPSTEVVQIAILETPLFSHFKQYVLDQIQIFASWLNFHCRNFLNDFTYIVAFAFFLHVLHVKKIL
ncbi:hypothetical protein L484_011900 [Morus notabilis]|uniref:Uncharacterized protein n=1 Tax=Morus notabilis TaxID=981085 RepID=W9RRZ5_9ROSA|nr:hypothetical protein L484_011900 [Morus notabilis]